MVPRQAERGLRMRKLMWLALLTLMLAAGCSTGSDASSGRPVAARPAESTEGSVGAAVAADDPGLSRVDAAGNTAADVLLAYVRAQNRSDWKTVYSLAASPKGHYSSFAQLKSENAVPLDDFKIHETRIPEAGKALVRVSYSTIGFSALEGQTPEESRRVVVVRPPGEWWVLEKGDQDDALWKVAGKGPDD